MERSVSRGREALSSSGRGGLGNIRPTSTSRDRSHGPDDYSSSRGREPPVSISEIRSTGRGGAGNFRSPSRDPVDDKDVRAAGERDFIHAHEERDKEQVHSTGRGGAGNMSRSLSRGPSTSPAPQVHSSGRGGAGNIVPGPVPTFERGRTRPDEGIHSTGRGGLANLTSSPTPAQDVVEHHPGAYESSGRGGAGNMSRERSASGSRERSASKDRAEKGGIAGLWNRLHGGHHPATILESETATEAGPTTATTNGVGGGGRPTV
uniref:Uncharacterized protein n=1 Tax=Mycena chlorophos TaxID=658473 RepID=A0ABQ0LR49_MYCCL|nr:predicted protein [Mycena chlorophos]